MCYNLKAAIKTVSACERLHTAGTDGPTHTVKEK